MRAWLRRCAHTWDGLPLSIELAATQIGAAGSKGRVSQRRDVISRLEFELRSTVPELSGNQGHLDRKSLSRHLVAKTGKTQLSGEELEAVEDAADAARSANAHRCTPRLRHRRGDPMRVFPCTRDRIQPWIECCTATPAPHYPRAWTWCSQL